MAQDWRDDRIAELEGELAARDKRIAALEEELATKDRRSAELEQQVVALTKQVAELTEKIGRSSRNSHLPPSSDSPEARRRRRRDKKSKARRKRGGQPGHQGAHRVEIQCGHFLIAPLEHEGGEQFLLAANAAVAQVSRHGVELGN